MTRTQAFVMPSLIRLPLNESPVSTPLPSRSPSPVLHTPQPQSSTRLPTPGPSASRCELNCRPPHPRQFHSQVAASNITPLFAFPVEPPMLQLQLLQTPLFFITSQMSSANTDLLSDTTKVAIPSDSENEEANAHHVATLAKAFKDGLTLDASYNEILKAVMENAKSRDALMKAVMDSTELHDLVLPYAP
ncbi:hypothetical protein BDP27DRAFT_1440665 [Rhodocollybia butyracea]|uniref:Uncharacterized protein n=1 Tax=Rhodocollybia butyracea TaxID=206335 RepID=A0A9P5TVB6_9AGAR|nr:hypothetical protein BDP27DRAFT_1440665 [Rhodocollybia butyracea]